MVEAETAYRRAAEIQEKLEQDFAGKPEDRRDLAQSHYQAAILFRDAGRALEAEKLLGHAIPHFQKLVTEFPKVPEYRSTLAYAHNELGWFMRRANNGRLPEAEKEQRLSLALFEELATDFPTVTHYQSERAEVLQTIANLLRDRGDLAGAKPLMEAATTYARSVLQAVPQRIYHERLRRDQMDLANLLVQLGEPAAAEKSLRQALADCEKQVAETPTEPDSRKALAETRIAIALFLKNSGRSPEAEEFYRLALDSYDKLAAEFPTINAYPQTAFEQRFNLGQFLVEAGRTEEALDVYRQAIDLQTKLAADVPTKLNHWQGLVRTHVELGGLLAKGGKEAEAETAYRQALELQEKLDKDFAGKLEERRDLAQSHLQAAELFRAVDRLQDAEKLYRLAIDQAAKVAIDPPTTDDGARLMGHAYGNLAFLVQLKAGRTDDALATLREALSRFDKLATEFPDVPTHRYWLANMHCAIGKPLHDMGRRAEAEEGNRRAIDILEKLVVECPAEAEYRRFLAVNYGHLANHHRIVNRFEEAEKSLRQASALWKHLATEFPTARDYQVQLVGAQSGLAVVLAQQGKHNEAAEVAADLDDPQLQNNIAWQIVSGSAPNPDASKWAVELAQKAVTGAPDAAHIINTLGTAYYRAGDWKAAIDTLKRADALYGGRQFSANAFFIAMAHWQLGEKDQARKWYLPALVWMEKYGPKNEELLRFRAEAAYLLGLPERVSPEHEQVKADGVEYYTLVLEAHPEAVWAHGKRGAFYAELGQWKEAAAAFSRAIELHSDDLDGVWLPLALLQLKAGQTDDYRRLVSAALDRFGKTEELAVAVNLAILAKLAPGSADELAVILQILERTLAHKPDDGLAVAIRAHLLIRAGRAAKGVALLEAMVAATPDGQGDQRFNLLFLALGRMQLGRDAEALEAFRAAERWQDTRFNAWFHQVDFDRTRDELAAMLGVNELPHKQSATPKTKSGR